MSFLRFTKRFVNIFPVKFWSRCNYCHLSTMSQNVRIFNNGGILYENDQLKNRSILLHSTSGETIWRFSPKMMGLADPPQENAAKMETLARRAAEPRKRNKRKDVLKGDFGQRKEIKHWRVGNDITSLWDMNNIYCTIILLYIVWFYMWDIKGFEAPPWNWWQLIILLVHWFTPITFRRIMPSGSIQFNLEL